MPEPMASGEVAPYALADDGTNLYWVSPAVKDEVSFRSRVRRVAKTSTGGKVEDLFGSTEVRARSLGFAGGKLYWGDLGANPGDTANQELKTGTPGTGACCTLVADDQIGAEHLTLGGDNVYWLLTGGNGAVRGKLADGTGSVVPDVSGQRNPRWVVVDAEARPYWVENSTGSPREVRRLKQGSTSEGEMFVSGQDLVAVELVGGRVWWADRNGGTVRSAAKTDTLPAQGREEFAGHGKVEGFRVVEASGGGSAGASGAGGAGGEAVLYVLTAQGRQLQAWRKGPEDEAALLLGEVGAKADAYAGNPFGAAYVLVDDKYIYFADAGTITGATPEFVSISAGDGIIYRVAK